MEQLPLAYAKLLKAYYGEIVLFSEEDKPALLNVMRTFIFWGDDDKLEKLVGVANQLPGGIAAELGRLFIKEGYYHLGLDFYNYAVQQAVDSGNLVQSELYYNQGYCLHRQNKPLAATQAFVNAYEAGYRANDIYEFLRWNVDKLGDSSVKERAKEILRVATAEEELTHKGEISKNILLRREENNG